MSWSSALLLLFLALIGAPLFMVFGAGAMLGFNDVSSVEQITITAAASDIFGEKFASSIILVTIPLFTFAGYLMAESRTPQRLIDAANAWLGWMPGGVPMVALVACSFFTALTGGSGVTIIALGGLLYPMLRSVKYSERFALGMVTTGGSLGILFVPAIPVILYAFVGSPVSAELTGEGIIVEKLFLAGAIPGLLTVVALWVYSVFVGRRARIPRTPFVLKTALRTFRAAFWEIILPVILVVGLGKGWLRIHEAAAFTAAYTLVIELFVYKDIKLRELPRVIRQGTTLVGAIMAILATAVGFTGFLIYDEIPQKMLLLIEGLITDKWTFLLVLNIFLVIVAMIMEGISAIIVVVPLVIPLAVHYRVDPYHLGILFLLNLEIGFLLPPVGLNLFISSFRFDRPVVLLYRAILPFVAVLGLVVIATTYIEDLSLWPLRTFTGYVSPEPVHRPEEEPLEDELPLEEELDDGGGGLDDLEEELDDGGGGLDDLERELEELEGGGGEGDDGDDSGGSALDALEEELDEDGAPEPEPAPTMMEP